MYTHRYIRNLQLLLYLLYNQFRFYQNNIINIFFLFCKATALNSYFEFKSKSTKNFVLLEKTFPKLSAFTISTWLMIHNYSYTFNNVDEYLKKDYRTIFSYSLDQHTNMLRLQVSSIVKSVMQNNKRITVRFSITLNVLQSICNANIEYTYKDNFFWLHLAVTWKSKSF
jgi:hypothetical protein